MVKIIVATHKPYRMPQDSMYLPVQVGAAGKDSIGFQRDDEHDNISEKNAGYCELTGLYWAWKNVDADFIGLAHYRRHFSLQKKGDKFDRVLSTQEAEALCAQCPVLVAKRRNYVIETIYSHYVHAHKKEGPDALIELIDREYPAYSAACHTLFNRTWAHMFNMCVMRKDIFDGYCTWLFEVLGKLEQKLDLTGWNTTEQRVYGFMSEFMLDMYLMTHQISYQEIPVLFMEKQSMVKKALGVVKRKFIQPEGI